MSDAALVIMARYPELGKVKTRLAQSLGDDATLRIYQACLRDLAERFAGWQYTLHWAYTPGDCDFSAFARTLVPEREVSMRAFPQQGPDLGSRLYRAFQVTASQHFARTILIGSDSPQISRDIILQADQALASADVVLGPAEDGGYYLIAMREPHEVFQDIPMSTERVLAMTIEKAQRQGLQVALLETLFDIDTQPDLMRLMTLLDHDRTLAPYTMSCLSELMKRGVIA
jgi:rSAM/selenodomain-associated transferase 1